MLGVVENVIMQILIDPAEILYDVPRNRFVAVTLLDIVLKYDPKAGVLTMRVKEGVVWDERFLDSDVVIWRFWFYTLFFLGRSRLLWFWLRMLRGVLLGVG